MALEDVRVFRIAFRPHFAALVAGTSAGTKESVPKRFHANGVHQKVVFHIRFRLSTCLDVHALGISVMNSLVVEIEHCYDHT